MPLRIAWYGRAMTSIFPNPGIGWYALEWVIRLAAIFVVPPRRRPAATAGWLLLIFFEPIIGAALFALIGYPRFPAWRTARFGLLLPWFERVCAALHGAAPVPATPVTTLAETLGHLPAVGGNAIELIDDYDEVIDRLVGDIDAASMRVNIIVYIFADDAVGRRVIAALGRAVARGVVCRVMLDPVGSHRWRKDTVARLRAAGVEVHEALPFRLWRGRTRRDMRNHRKLFAIDGRIGYAGSQNIVAKDFRPGVVNRELVARVEGPIVAAIEAAICADWFMETEADPGNPPAVPSPAGSSDLQLLPSGADYPLEGFETLIVWQLHRAASRAILVTPYLIPDEDLVGAMRTAVARGVEVHVVVSAVVDQPFVNLAQCSYYDDLLSAGVRIHRFRDFLLHAKNVSIDGRLAIVGSSNVDLRSFQLNEEASLLLLDPASVAKVWAIQQGYLTASDTLDLAAWRQRPRWRRVAENVARLVSPLL